tara:strand:- start:1074 stop:1208 length:135 start_codon:yes stop_codon:yes gene_type:complete
MNDSFLGSSGRKEMPLPDGASAQRKMDNALVKLLAFRRNRMLVF